MMFKIDLHTHSSASPDGGIKPEQYRQALQSGLLDAIAVTDHNRIDFATLLKRELGDKIIVGEEIMSTKGEIIGLFLSEPVSPGLSPIETIKAIKDQEGLVYVPHPFETVRKGLHPEVLEELAEHVDVVEICNGRAWLQDRSAQVVVWARMNHVLGAASSDAHGLRGLGKTYTSVDELPNRDNLMALLAKSRPITNRPGLSSLLYPKYNVLRKKLRKTSR
jgi:predicted metal-dependent phosphoesterase TrpH